jgi:hypothetical protein
MRGSGSDAPSIAARIRARVIIGLLVLGVAATPAHAASGGPSPDPSPHASAGTVSATPPPDPAPQAQTQSGSAGAGSQTSSGSDVPATRSPAGSTTHPSSAAPAQVGGSEVLTHTPVTTRSGSTSRTYGSAGATPAIRAPDHVLRTTPKRAHRLRTRRAHPHSHRAHAARQTATRRRDLLASATAMLLSAPSDRHRGLLLLFTSLALALLAVAGLSLVRVLRRMQAEWWDRSVR